MNRVQGKVAVVTGGAMGIGKACAVLLAREGAAVAVTDIKENEGREVVEEIGKAGGTADFWRIDTSDEEMVRKAFSEIVGKWGSIDVLVNNAGISGANKLTHEITGEEWESLLKINVNGVFFCTKHAIGYMREKGGGSIINMASIAGIISAANLPPYHASKGAVRAMTKNDAILYAKEKIRVNSVHPAYIWTPLVEEIARNSPEGLEAFKEKIDSLHPIGHVGEPDDIAYGVLYLASDEAKFVTGAELVIDGGYVAQ